MGKIFLSIVALLVACSTAGAALPEPGKKIPGEAEAAAGKFSGTVEVYLTDWCYYCKQTRQYLEKKGVRYTAYDIEKDPAAQRRHRELGGRGVPLVVIGDHRISGFSPEAMDYYLSLER